MKKKISDDKFWEIINSHSALATPEQLLNRYFNQLSDCKCSELEQENKRLRKKIEKDIEESKALKAIIICLIGVVTFLVSAWFFKGVQF